MSSIKPTQEELKRDLIDDLELVESGMFTYRQVVLGWPIAIRRAVWAEAELKKVLFLLAEEGYKCHLITSSLDGKEPLPFREFAGDYLRKLKQEAKECDG